MTEDRSQRRLVVLSLVALVLAGAGIAVWLAQKDDDVSAQPATGSAASRSPATPPPALGTPGTGGGPVVTEVEGRSGGSSVGPGREAVIDGVRIRDHRRNGGAVGQGTMPPNIRPPDVRKLSAESVAAITSKVQGAVKECAAAVPPEARGDKPRLEGELIVNVKAGQVTVVQTTVQVRRVAGDASERTKQCLEQRATGLSAQAVDGEADVDSYAIQLNYALP